MRANASAILGFRDTIRADEISARMGFAQNPGSPEPKGLSKNSKQA